jgi:hypothetical protein
MKRFYGLISVVSAINYVRSMKDGDFKLQCLIQIVQALSQPNL